MTNLLQENIRMESQRTNSTPARSAGGFAIHTNQRPNPKLQKSYFLLTLVQKLKK